MNSIRGNDMTQEIRKQMKAVCCECHRLVNEDHEPGRYLTDSEYVIFGQNADESHGYCRECAAAFRKEIAATRVERNTALRNI